MQKNQWIWQNNSWPVFYYDASALLTDIGVVSRLAGGLEAIYRTLNNKEQINVQERVLADDAMETSAIEGEVLRRSSVRASIRKQLGLPVEVDDWDAHADGLVSMLLDARDISQPSTHRRKTAWLACCPFSFRLFRAT